MEERGGKGKKTLKQHISFLYFLVGQNVRTFMVNLFKGKQFTKGFPVLIVFQMCYSLFPSFMVVSNNESQSTFQHYIYFSSMS